jgi:hypothetical protein
MDWLDDGTLNQSVMNMFCQNPVFKDSSGITIINYGSRRSPDLRDQVVATYSCSDNGSTLIGTSDNFNMKSRLSTAGVKTTPNGTTKGLIEQAPVNMQLVIDYLLKESAGNRP